MPNDHSITETPFDFLRNTEPVLILNLIRQELPQTIAVVLCHLEPCKASIVLENLPYEVQSDIFRRIINMGNIQLDAIQVIEQVLKEKLSYLEPCSTTAGGIDAAVENLNVAHISVKRQVIEALKDEDPWLAEELQQHLTKEESEVENG